MISGHAQSFTLRINGSERRLTADGDAPLLDVLRNALGLKGTRFGCGSEQCGACFVLIDGRAAPSCTTTLGSVAGKSIVTVEGLGGPESPHPLQKAFITEQAAQCGYCTNGMVMTSAALIAQNQMPSLQEIKDALSANLCRCGTHDRVLAAVMRATGRARG